MASDGAADDVSPARLELAISCPQPARIRSAQFASRCRWLDKDEPDPFNVHFEAMCRALVLLCEGVSGLEVDDLHLWIDYTCIPQKNV